LFEEGSEMEQHRRGTVVVEVDKVENLREAYPNYFLDMSLFHGNLQRVIEGKAIQTSFIDAPEPEKPKVRAISASDYSWLNDWRSKR
jgi:hypothetical protein